MARTERESERRREMENLLVLPGPAKSLQNGEGFSGKNLNILGLPKRKGWSLCHKLNGWKERQSRLCQKEQSYLSRSPDREVGESQGKREPLLGEKKGDRSGSMERKK